MATEAQKRFGLDSQNWLIPQSKAMFYVDFRVNAGASTLDQRTLERCAMMVKRCGRPTSTQNVTVQNQYNRRRLNHGKIQWEPIQIACHDSVDNPVINLVREYQSFYWGDAKFSKQIQSFSSDIVTPSFETFKDWGYSIDNASIDGNFFSSIDIFEFYGANFTVWNLINPKIIQVQIDDRDIENHLPSEVIMTVDYEGITNIYRDRGNQINAPLQDVDQDLARKVNIAYSGGAGGFLRSNTGFLTDPVVESQLGSVFGAVQQATITKNLNIKGLAMSAASSTLNRTAIGKIASFGRSFFG